MNKARRKEIGKAVELLIEARLSLETARDGEQEALDALPESFRDGEKGSAMEETIDRLETLISELETAEDEARELSQ